MSPWLRFDECSKFAIVQLWRHHVLLIGVVVLFARRLETESPKYPRCRFFFVFGPVWATACCVSNLDLAPWTYLTSVSVNNSYRGLVSDFRNGNNEQNLAFLQLSILTLIFLLRTLKSFILHSSPKKDSNTLNY